MDDSSAIDRVFRKNFAAAVGAVTYYNWGLNRGPNRILVAFADFPIEGHSDGRAGSRAYEIARQMAPNIKQRWDEIPIENTTKEEFDLRLSSIKGGKTAMVIFAHGDRGEAYDYHQQGERRPQWDVISSVNKASGTRVAGVFLGICQYGMTSDGAVSVTGNVQQYRARLWGHEAEVEYWREKDPDSEHIHIVPELRSFLRGLGW